MLQEGPVDNKALRLIWIDLEMTGLNPDKDRILELATIVTDSDLNIIAEGPVFAVSQPEALIAQMDEWNTNQHHQSGLIERMRKEGVSEAVAEAETIAFLRQYVDEKTSPMCGNSICQDRRFLVKYMPQLSHYFHYRHIDVSTLKELVRRWQPDLLTHFKKQEKHLALEDIKDSIRELQYYRKHFIAS